MDVDKKDFLLHLYDKLWENMDSKEGRLWNFLGLYGVGIAVAFGAGRLAGLELSALIVVLILSYWAVLIVVNANWWYYRNLLMVTRVEKEFEAGLIGVVPKFYRESPPFQFDRLHRGTIHILLFIGTLFYIRGTTSYLSSAAIGDRRTCLALLVVYAIYTLGPFYWLWFHEHFLRRYYETKVDLWVEAEEKNAEKKRTKSEIEASFEDEEKKSRGRYNWRWAGVLAMTLGSVFVDLALRANSGGNATWLFAAISAQVVATALSIYFYRTFPSQNNFIGLLGWPQKEKSQPRGTLVASLMYLLVVFSCISLFLYWAAAHNASRGIHPFDPSSLFLYLITS
jgi:hypothetical protein